MRAHLFSGTALAAALFAAAPGVAGAQAPGQPQALPGTPPGPTRAETPGRPAIPASDVDYSKTMERLFQAAQRLRESVQSMAQQPAGDRRNQAMAQAREALLHTQQAMTSLPANLRTNQNYRDAEQRVAEAERALQGNQPDAQRAQGAVDALLIVVPRLQADARTAAAAGGTAGDATVVVREASPSIQVNQAQPTVTVRQPEPVVNVVVPQPEIIVRQPPPQVTVQMPEPQVTVRQERPDVRVVEAQPRVQVDPAQPQVRVERAQPRVNVQQAEGQPLVRYERQGEPGVATQQQAAAASGAGAPGTGAAPAQSGGASQLAAASPAAAGVPLQRAQSLVGTNLIGANGKEAGEVENLLIDRGGQVRGAVVEWGGFLGIGERRAVVPINQIQFGNANDGRARLEMTREQLEQLPRYERDRLAEYGTRYGWGEGLRLFR